MADERADRDGRPSPDALLELARQEESRAGRLKIFLGAAPGVGKTYEMLQNVRARQRDGIDIVVGYVETHGRKETAALLDGLEVIPRRSIDYKGQVLEEMDLDGILARRPKMVAVDELAHSNGAGSRHPKRYLDVEELLANGIDVYTTLNVQHVESLNDVVAQITRIRVRETVPDSVLDRADEIELVDLTPGDLLQRLKEGKIYVPQQAERALEHFFSHDNLTALRELALRRTAERVDDQLLSRMKAQAISGPWAAGDRLLVCINEHPRAIGLVRYARLVADRLHAPWIALYVESRRTAQLDDAQRDRVADVLRLAQSLGAEAVTIPGGGRHTADDVIAYAKSNNITQIIVGKSARSRWFELINGSVVRELLDQAGNIAVSVVPGEREAAKATDRASVRLGSPNRTFDFRPYGWSTAITGFSLGAGLMLQPIVSDSNVDLVFLTGVVAVAVRFGLWPSIYASVLAAIGYNFFFTQPYLSFQIDDPRSVLAVVFFTVVAIVVSNVAARAQVQAVAALARARTTESLYAFSRKLAGVGAIDDVLWVTAYQIALMLQASVVLLLPENGSLEVKTGYPPEDTLEPADVAAAKWAWENNRPAGHGSDTLTGAKWLFLPMVTGRGPIGMIGVADSGSGFHLTPDQRRLLDALIDQGALAIERVNLVEDIEKTRLSVETEKLRSAILTSLSHDLKTPLASVLGAAGALRDLSGLTDVQRDDLLSTVIDEAERLNRFIANLLDMMKLESGAVRPTSEPHDISEVVGSVLRRAAKILAEHKIEVALAPDLPMVEIDPVLFEQVLFNVLDNASKYAPTGTTVRIGAQRAHDKIRLQIEDEGSGVPTGEAEHIFDRFHRATKGDQVRAGTGLGLTIARGFIEAMGGSISAGNRIDRSGAVFTIELPIPTSPVRIGPTP
jgi:two-component system, OmpR family, sensor histidine kinase KdpD